MKENRAIQRKIAKVTQIQYLKDLKAELEISLTDIYKLNEKIQLLLLKNKKDGRNYVTASEAFKKAAAVVESHLSDTETELSSLEFSLEEQD